MSGGAAPIAEVAQSPGGYTFALADWFALIATPAFALMALLPARGNLGAMPSPCGVVSASTFDGMAPMYALMSVLHLAPWIRMVAAQGTRH